MKRTMPCESPGLAARMSREQWLNRYLGDTSVSLTEGCPKTISPNAMYSGNDHSTCLFNPFELWTAPDRFPRLSALPAHVVYHHFCCKVSSLS